MLVWRWRCLCWTARRHWSPGPGPAPPSSPPRSPASRWSSAPCTPGQFPGHVIHSLLFLFTIHFYSYFHCLGIEFIHGNRKCTFICLSLAELCQQPAAASCCVSHFRMVDVTMSRFVLITSCYIITLCRHVRLLTHVTLQLLHGAAGG